MVLDSFHYNTNYVVHPQVKAEILPKFEGAASFLRAHSGQHRVHVLRQKLDRKDWLLPTTIGTTLRLPFIEGNTIFCQRRYARYCAFMAGQREPSQILPFSGGVRLTSDSNNLRLLDLMSVKYILVDEGRPHFGWKDPNILEAAEAGFEGPVYEGEITIYENRRALPRAYIVHRTALVKDEDDILNQLANPGFDPWTTVIVEEDVEGMALTTEASARESRAEIETYSAQEVVVEATAADRGILVLTDLWYPGWKAFVDGQEADILRANYLFRGVVVDSGQHRVRFVYEPTSFKVGAILSVLGACLVGFMVYVGSRKVNNASAPERR